MSFDPDRILAILDDAYASFTFPMLDNGYIYPAASRLSLFRSSTDWAIVIEVFGFSPRAGLPDTAIHTFASRPHNRNRPENYVTPEAHAEYLANNPNNESRFVHPIEPGPWQDADSGETVVDGELDVILRGRAIKLPPAAAYATHGIHLEQAPKVQVFELCRYLADVARDQVLARPDEQRISVLPEMMQLLQLEEWHHPDVANDQRPSQSETFQQLARVLAAGDPSLYRPTLPPNTHWRHWPEAGRL